MKASFYNFLVPHTEFPGKFILFNGFNKALFILDEAEKLQVEQLLENPDYSSGNLELRKTLIENGLIIEDDQNELNMVRHKYLKSLYDNTQMALTILPTLECNFACTYCYQNHSRDQYQLEMNKCQMSEEVKARIVPYIKRKLNTGVKNVLVKWFGGEPTLVLDEIVEMSQKINKICEQKQASFECQITTNGYLLDVEKLRPILPYLSQVDITIDGPATTHDSRRVYPGGSSYDRILQNIKNLQIENPQLGVWLRINLDKTIGKAIPDFLDDLKQRGIDKLHLTMKTLYVDEQKYPELFQTVYSKEDFAKIIPSFIREAIKRDLITSFSPYLSFLRCRVSCQNVFVIMPDGKLHKCWGSLPLDEAAVGELGENGEEILNHKVVDWYTYNPLDKLNCTKCKFLPLCMGGCCYNDVVPRWKGDCLLRSDAGCTILKYNFTELLSLHACLLEGAENPAT